MKVDDTNGTSNRSQDAQENRSDPELSSDVEKLAELVARAEIGDEEILPRLREFLDRRPSIWESAGDVARQAQDAQIALYAGPNLLLRESVERKLDALKDELSVPDQSALEALIIERVMISWLQAGTADAQLAQADDVSKATAYTRQRRVDQSNRRFLAASRQLATVRKLLKETAEISAMMYGEQSGCTDTDKLT
jgi:hypothetical protein